MAYRLKYFHNHTDQDGQVVRFEIYEDAPALIRPLQMNGLAALQLEIQGSQGVVDQAIVKTSLRFSLVDAPEKNTLTQKWGGWEEFYTPDSTKYKVVLLTLVEDEYVTRWTGYITPDSWEESLAYHGTITITARDNIGHLQDFEFDEKGDDDGLISLEDLVANGMAKIAFPMFYHWDTLDYEGHDWQMLKSSNGKRIQELKINTAAFEGSNWYDAIETTLGDLGYVLRFVDNNRWVVTPLRNMSLCGEGDDQSVERKTLVFFDGTKSLNPPYKSITDTLQYDYEPEVNYDLRKNYRLGEDHNYPTRITNDWGTSSMVLGTGVRTDFAGSSTTRGWIAGNAFMRLNPAFKDFVQSSLDFVDINTFVGMASNRDSNGMSGNLFLDYNFGAVASLALKVKVELSPYPVEQFAGIHLVEGYLRQIKYALVYEEENGASHYYNSSVNAFRDTPVANSVSSSDGISEIEINLLYTSFSQINITEGGRLIIELIDPVFHTTNPWLSNTGIFLAIKGISIDNVTDGFAGNKLTTSPEENAKYNITNEKSDTIGPMVKNVKWVTTGNYKNVLYDDAANMTPYEFRWTDSPIGETFPLPLLIHLERLAYHGTTKAIIEGDAVVDGGSGFRMNAIYRYKGVYYLLTSGTLDLLTGRMSVTLYQLT